MGNTLWRVFVGFGLAMVVSTPLGIVMGSFRNQESFFEPPVILGLTMPGLIWALLMIMVFGIKEISAYLAVAVTISPMLTISIWQGTKSIDKDLIDMSTAFHASVLSKLVDVILPQLVSHILAAIRYGLGLAWKVIVLVEGFGFSNGVGYQVMHQFDLFSVKGGAGLGHHVPDRDDLSGVRRGGRPGAQRHPLAAAGRGLEAVGGLRTYRRRGQVLFP